MFPNKYLQMQHYVFKCHSVVDIYPIYRYHFTNLKNPTFYPAMSTLVSK